MVMAGLTDGDWPTRRVRIAGESRLAGADGLMVGDATIGIEATRSRARIDALLADASTVAWAVAVDDALWTAVGSRSDHVGQATTSCLVVNHLAGAVGSTRGRHARIGELRLNWRCHNCWVNDKAGQLSVHKDSLHE